MAKKPNYGFERSEQTRQKAARLVAKQENAAIGKDADTVPTPPEPSED